MSEAASQLVKSLFVTLRRSHAGTPWYNRRILEALGLKRRHQCIEKPNSPMIRGMLLKVPHLVIIETDRMRYLRELKEYHEQLARPPWILHHDPLLNAATTTAATPTAGSLPGPEPGSPALAPGPAPPAGLPAAVPAVPRPPPPPPRRLTPFTVQQLEEHVYPKGLEGYAQMVQRPQVPLPYFKEQARRWRVKVLTERGMFGADAQREHREAIAPKAYRRKVGLRD